MYLILIQLCQENKLYGYASLTLVIWQSVSSIKGRYRIREIGKQNL